MRRFHGYLLAGLLPVAAMAQDGQAVIRIEAKRGAAAVAEAVRGWQAQFDNVVTFPLARGWTGIALGPMTQAEAQAMLDRLKAAGSIPGDSFVAVPGGDVALTPATPGTASDAPQTQPDTAAETLVQTDAEAPADSAPDTMPDTMPDAAAQTTPPQADRVAVPAMDMNLDPLSAPPPGTAAPDRHIRLEAFQDRAEADAALQKWRETFPEAGLWNLPNGWFAIALGPMTEGTATAWLQSFKSAEAVPKDAFLATTTELGAPAALGSSPDLAAPPAEPAPMPPLDQVQRALRWAGLYDGEIDGKSGPMTRAAIAAEVMANRASPDPGTAMAALIQRRADWRDQMGLTQLDDPHTGLSATAPMDLLQFDRNERALSIYGPKDGSGAALILFSQPGGKQELVDLSGLIIALGWVPRPDRNMQPGAFTLDGRNDTHISHAEGRVRDGRAEGFVLIWPATAAEDQPRVSAELSDSFTRSAPAKNDPVTETATETALPAEN